MAAFSKLVATIDLRIEEAQKHNHQVLYKNQY